MRAELLSIGTELLLGHTVNTDAALVARELSALGIDLLFSSTVGDNAGRLREALTTALRRSDLIITTGGLGPTQDDLTKETISQTLGVPLILHEPSLQHLESFFAGRPMSDNQRKQARLPRGAVVFPNAKGTAPGCAVTTPEHVHVIMLPGPPRELEPMLTENVIPYLSTKKTGAIGSTMIRTFGLGEGSIAERLAGVTPLANPTVATYARDTETFIRVTAKAASPEQAQSLCQPLVDSIHRELGDFVYGIDVENLEQVVVALLKKQHLLLATAESCTGGLLAKRITDIPGASEVLHTGFITYANASKVTHLGVSEALLAQYGAVSEPVACAMARGVRTRTQSDLGIGITGIAGPGGGSPEKPVGLIYVALSTMQGTWVRKINMSSRTHDRAWLREYASSVALDLLRRHLSRYEQRNCTFYQESSKNF